MSSEFLQKQKPPIKLISEYFIKPKHDIEAAKKPYDLGPIDLVFLTIDPIQKGLLFKLDHQTQPIGSTYRATHISHILEKLKNSLSIALLHFYPLAGRLTTRIHAEDNASSIFVDCNKGPGARFIHAGALDVFVSDVMSPVDVTVVRPFFDLGEKMVNYDGHTKALLSIQVTELFDGVFIGFSISHSVVDGTSFIHFIHMLSDIFRSHDNNTSVNTSLTQRQGLVAYNNTSVSNVTQISRVPIFNYRPWLIYNENKDDDDSIIKLPYLNPEEFVNRAYEPGPLRERIFHFSKETMAMLKAKANQECGIKNVISSFQALTALMWKSITQARNLASDEQTSCFMAIGARGRFNPPISDDYFGNFLSMARWSCKVDELLSNNLGFAAMNLMELVKAQNEEKIIQNYDYFLKSRELIRRGSGPNVHGENSVIMGGSARFDMYGPEFGMGRALAARMGYGNKEDGKVTANPGCQDDGSVDLEICLRPQIMATLEANEEFMSYVSVQ